MSTKSSLKNALSNIDDAENSINRALRDVKKAE